MENNTAFNNSTGAAKTERFAARLGSDDHDNNISRHYAGAKRPREPTAREGFPGQNPAICGRDAPDSDWPFLRLMSGRRFFFLIYFMIIDVES